MKKQIFLSLLLTITLNAFSATSEQALTTPTSEFANDLEKFKEVMELIVPKAVPVAKKYLVGKLTKEQIEIIQDALNTEKGLQRKRQTLLLQLWPEIAQCLKDADANFDYSKNSRLSFQELKVFMEHKTTEKMRNIIASKLSKNKELKDLGKQSEKAQDSVTRIFDPLKMMEECLKSDEVNALVNRYYFDMFRQNLFTYHACNQLPYYEEAMINILDKSVDELVHEMNAKS